MTHGTRIIVTGSRLWWDQKLLFDTLDDVTVDFGQVTLVHGMCDPRELDENGDARMVPWADALSLKDRSELLGADWWADAHARRRSWSVVQMPARWTAGKQGGPRRNREMVNMGADLVVGFPIGDSLGTRHCLKLALEAHIPILTKEGELLAPHQEAAA